MLIAFSHEWLTFPKSCSISRTQHEHCCNDDVGEESKEAEDEVAALAEASPDHLEEGLSARSTDLELHGDHSKQQDLYRGPGGVPKGTTHSILKKTMHGLKS